MKKIFAFVLALVLCFGCFSAFAAVTFNVDEYTTDELIAIRTKIIAEIMVRGIDKEIRVPQGKYVIGIDIPAGTYSISVEGEYALSMIVVHSNQYTEDYAYFYTVSDTDIIGKLQLKNGNVIDLTGSVITLKPYQGLGF